MKPVHQRQWKQQCQRRAVQPEPVAIQTAATGDMRRECFTPLLGISSVPADHGEEQSEQIVKRQVDHSVALPIDDIPFSVIANQVPGVEITVLRNYGERIEPCFRDTRLYPASALAH